MIYFFLQTPLHRSYFIVQYLQISAMNEHTVLFVLEVSSSTGTKANAVPTFLKFKDLTRNQISTKKYCIYFSRMEFTEVVLKNVRSSFYKCLVFIRRIYSTNSHTRTRNILDRQIYSTDRHAD